MDLLRVEQYVTRTIIAVCGILSFHWYLNQLPGIEAPTYSFAYRSAFNSNVLATSTSAFPSGFADFNTAHSSDSSTTFSDVSTAVPSPYPSALANVSTSTTVLNYSNHSNEGSSSYVINGDNPMTEEIPDQPPVSENVHNNSSSDSSSYFDCFGYSKNLRNAYMIYSSHNIPEDMVYIALVLLAIMSMAIKVSDHFKRPRPPRHLPAHITQWQRNVTDPVTVHFSTSLETLVKASNQTWVALEDGKGSYTEYDMLLWKGELEEANESVQKVQKELNTSEQDSIDLQTKLKEVKKKHAEEMDGKKEEIQGLEEELETKEKRCSYLRKEAEEQLGKRRASDGKAAGLESRVSKLEKEVSRSNSILAEKEKEENALKVREEKCKAIEEGGKELARKLEMAVKENESLKEKKEGEEEEGEKGEKQERVDEAEAPTQGPAQASRNVAASPAPQTGSASSASLPPPPSRTPSQGVSQPPVQGVSGSLFLRALDNSSGGPVATAGPQPAANNGNPVSGASNAPSQPAPPATSSGDTDPEEWTGNKQVASSEILSARRIHKLPVGRRTVRGTPAVARNAPLAAPTASHTPQVTTAPQPQPAPPATSSGDPDLQEWIGDKQVASSEVMSHRKIRKHPIGRRTARGTPSVATNAPPAAPAASQTPKITTAPPTGTTQPSNDKAEQQNSGVAECVALLTGSAPETSLLQPPISLTSAEDNNVAATAASPAFEVDSAPPETSPEPPNNGVPQGDNKPAAQAPPGLSREDNNVAATAASPALEVGFALQGSLLEPPNDDVPQGDNQAAAQASPGPDSGTRTCPEGMEGVERSQPAISGQSEDETTDVVGRSQQSTSEQNEDEAMDGVERSQSAEEPSAPQTTPAPAVAQPVASSSTLGQGDDQPSGKTEATQRRWPEHVDLTTLFTPRQPMDGIESTPVPPAMPTTSRAPLPTAAPPQARSQPPSAPTTQRNGRPMCTHCKVRVANPRTGRCTTCGMIRARKR